MLVNTQRFQSTAEAIEKVENAIRAQNSQYAKKLETQTVEKI